MEKIRLPFELIVIDLETNGLEVPEVRIVEIGAVRMTRDFELADTFRSLVDGRPMTPVATAVNNITDAMLEGEQPFQEVSKGFVEWCRKSSDYVLGAWGAYFDLCVLRSEYRRIGVRYPHPGRGLDVKAIAWFETFCRGNPSSKGGVDSLCEQFGVEFEGTRHRALDDALAEARILQEIVRGRGSTEPRALRQTQG